MMKLDENSSVKLKAAYPAGTGGMDVRDINHQARIGDKKLKKGEGRESGQPGLS